MDTEKKRRKTGWGFRLMMIVLIGIAGFSAFQIGKILWEYHVGTKAYEEVQELAYSDGDDEREIDFDALRRENQDIKAWLYSEDTPIDYPVVQGEDNQYYLYRMFDGTWNGKGSLFVDFRCEEPFEDFNTIIYGHRMKDGSMFHSLTKYEKKSYYEEHPVLELTTPEKAYDVEVFAVVRIPSDSPMYQWSFENREARELYLQDVKEQNLLQIDIPVTADDNIVMMSTCTYEFEEARLVVYGKLT